MVDCKRIFEESRLLALLQSRDLRGKEKVFKAWSDCEYESQQTHKRGKLFSNGGKANHVQHDTDKSSGSKSAHGSHDISAGGTNSQLLEQNGERNSHRILTNEFRKIIESPIVERHVEWGDTDSDEQLQNSLYDVLRLGQVLIVNNIPKIPSRFDDDEVEYFGIDTEDDSFGRPHFFQFATRDFVVFAANFPILMMWLSRNATFKLSKKGHVCWGTNIEYELGNILKGWLANPNMLDVRWNKGRLTKYDLFYSKNKFTDWWQEGDRTVHLKVWDTLNHWPRSVKELGKTLTDSIGFDFTKLKFDPYSFKYAAMDAIISRSYAAVQRSYYKEKGIKLFFTAGATALNVYQNNTDDQGKNFCKHKLFKSHTEDELRWLIPSLHGGRTEVFSLKEYNDTVGYFDINSAYPYAMKFGTFPNIMSHRWIKGDADIRRMIASPVEGVAEVEVDATKLDGFVSEIPYLGTVDPKNNRFVFPLGRWKDKYTFFEIRRAMELGYKFKFIEACYYPRCGDHPFKEYVDFCYAIRDEGTAKGDRMLRDIGKALGNNLFGKFGQRMRTSVLMPVDQCEPEVIDNSILLDGSAVVDVDEGFAKHTNVVWSAYITAMCRTLLYEHMMAAHANGNDILYCDTDSIFITGGKWPDSHQTRLGALKHEGDLSYFRAYLPKVYTYEMGGKREYKAKGVPFGDRERFMMLGMAEYKKPMKVREALRRTSTLKTEQPVELGVPAINAWITVEKHMKGEYTKREVLKDGSTKPLWLGDKK